MLSPLLILPNLRGEKWSCGDVDISAPATTAPKRIGVGNFADSLTTKQYIRVPPVNRCSMLLPRACMQGKISGLPTLKGK